MTDKEIFIEAFKKRTMQLAVDVIKFYKGLPNTEEARITGKQLIRCATSVAANYRAACRARSKAEFYAKISITIEECDETLFWLELIAAAEICTKPGIESLKLETTEILMVLSRARKTASQ